VIKIELPYQNAEALRDILLQSVDQIKADLDESKALNEPKLTQYLKTKLNTAQVLIHNLEQLTYI
jgi:hypothetical protein